MAAGCRGRRRVRDDGGFDVGAVGHLLLGARFNDTGAKYANWAGYVAKSVGGPKAWDQMFVGFGKSKIGIDFTQAYFKEPGFEGAAMTLAADQGIYFNASVDEGVLGSDDVKHRRHR